MATKPGPAGIGEVGLVCLIKPHQHACPGTDRTIDVPVMLLRGSLVRRASFEATAQAFSGRRENVCFSCRPFVGTGSIRASLAVLASTAGPPSADIQPSRLVVLVFAPVLRRFVRRCDGGRRGRCL
jgi:hypothetical protein